MDRRVEEIIALARQDAAWAAQYSNGQDYGMARGAVHALLMMGAIDCVRFDGLCNEFRFMRYRGIKRRAEGLPC